ncbi:hypothetical protein D915_000436 [Fasciola hepatica]|uniref:Uncharacterized protein n=1 Tax=Fasciola hepatica TaxID=6192 RepID=A0A4E0RR54_FASHE|nr:hypothetical protein D915_000436 [Fasciola hepatica]
MHNRVCVSTHRIPLENLAPRKCATPFGLFPLSCTSYSKINDWRSYEVSFVFGGTMFHSPCVSKFEIFYFIADLIFVDFNSCFIIYGDLPRLLCKISCFPLILLRFQLFSLLHAWSCYWFIWIRSSSSCVFTLP